MYVRATYSGAKAEDAEWGASDYTGLADTDKSEFCILQVAVTVTAAVIEITLDSGTTWVALNSGVAISVGQLYQFDIYIASGDTFNIRAGNSSGTTVTAGTKLISDLDG